MFNGIHFLLTYTCNYECDHCFLYCSPRAAGTFSLKQVKQVLEEADKIGTVEWIYFEGGEPLLYYPLLLAAIEAARDHGYKTGLVTNSYMSTSDEDAELWLKPLKDKGVDFVSISDDNFHSDGDANRPAGYALSAAEKLKIPVGPICIEEFEVERSKGKPDEKGRPVIGGDTLLKGRAVDKLTDDLPCIPASLLTECRDEELVSPERVHIDAFGHVHICQGLIIGNMWETPLSQIIKNYRNETHPICGPLVAGGPFRLAETHGLPTDGDYVSECHFCYITRRALIEKFPKYLAPPQAYGFAD